jgi:hypothetical protein
MSTENVGFSSVTIRHQKRVSEDPSLSFLVYGVRRNIDPQSEDGAAMRTELR